MITTQVKVNVSKYPRIHTDMLVQDTKGNIGFVNLITSKWVHVTILVNVDYTEADAANQMPYHVLRRYKRSDLRPSPVGMELTISQRDISKA